MRLVRSLRRKKDAYVHRALVQLKVIEQIHFYESESIKIVEKTLKSVNSRALFMENAEAFNSIVQFSMGDYGQIGKLTKYSHNFWRERLTHVVLDSNNSPRLNFDQENLNIDGIENLRILNDIETNSILRVLETWSIFRLLKIANPESLKDQGIFISGTSSVLMGILLRKNNPNAKITVGFSGYFSEKTKEACKSNNISIFNLDSFNEVCRDKFDLVICKLDKELLENEVDHLISLTFRRLKKEGKGLIFSHNRDSFEAELEGTFGDLIKKLNHELEAMIEPDVFSQKIQYSLESINNLKISEMGTLHPRALIFPNQFCSEDMLDLIRLERFGSFNGFSKKGNLNYAVLNGEKTPLSEDSTEGFNRSSAAALVCYKNILNKCLQKVPSPKARQIYDWLLKRYPYLT